MNQNIFNDYVISKPMIKELIIFVRNQNRLGEYDFLTLINKETGYFIQTTLQEDGYYLEWGDGKKVVKIEEGHSFENVVEAFNDFYDEGSLVKTFEKLDFDDVKGNDIKSLRRLTKEKGTNWLTAIERRFWIEFHEWASQKLEERLNVKVSNEEELFDCMTEQLNNSYRYIAGEIEQLMIEFLREDFKQ